MKYAKLKVKSDHAKIRNQLNGFKSGSSKLIISRELVKKICAKNKSGVFL